MACDGVLGESVEVVALAAVCDQELDVTRGRLAEAARCQGLRDRVGTAGGTAVGAS
jgi:hypothetical protein